MAYEILMPQLGLTMEEGVVGEWFKKEGETVQNGEALLSIETDKLSSEVISEHDGVLLKIVAQEGDDVPVRGLLGYIGQSGEVIDETVQHADNTDVPAAPVPDCAAAPVEAEETERMRVSPLARKVAADLGVELAGIQGSGTSGRITQKDVLQADANRQAAASSSDACVAAKAPVVGDTVVKMSSMRKVVAQRMLQSHAEIPPVTQVTKVDVTELMALRKDILDHCGKKYSVNDMILAATAKVLSAHPEMLVSYGEDQIIQHAQVNIGVAVALDGGLIVPVIKDADKKNLDSISAAAKDLALRAKNNQLLADEYKGSTFSMTNLGMFGVEVFTPIINQPDAAILGVGAIDDELRMNDDGTIKNHKVLRLSLTYDHRLIDGAVAAKFSADLRDMLQKPLQIIL